MDVSAVSLKQIKKMIKQPGFKIKTITELSVVVKILDDNEILLFKYPSTDKMKAICITKCIKDNMSPDSLGIDLNNVNIKKSKSFREKKHMDA